MTVMVDPRLAVPERSLQQRREALVRANEIRSYRAQLKKDIAARDRDVVGVLMEAPAMVETMAVVDLLLSVPKYGRVKVNRLLLRERISPSKTVGGLSARQRQALVVALAGARGRRP